MDSRLTRRWLGGFAAMAACLLIGSCEPRQRFADRHLHPPVFSAAFRGGSALDAQGQKLRFRLEMLGNLKLPSGHIVAVDPSALAHASVFAVHVDPGTYAIGLAIADGPKAPRIAFAEIVFADKPVAYWKMAVPERAEPDRSKSSELVGYRVGSGIGSFMDAATATTLAAAEHGQDFRSALDALIAQPPAEPLRALLSMGDTNVAVFASGAGNGDYASYFGFTADGRAVALLTDFGLVPWKP